MTTQIQYYTNEKGQKTSVLVPFLEWEKINEELAALRFRLSVFESIKEGIKEVKTARQNGTKLPTLAQFIDENRNSHH